MSYTWNDINDAKIVNGKYGFGRRIAIDGDYMAIGTSLDEDTLSREGILYI